MSKELQALRLISLIDEAKANNEAYKKAKKHKLLFIFDDAKAVLDNKQVVAEAMDILIADSEITAFTLIFGILRIACNLRVKRTYGGSSGRLHIVPGEGHNGLIVDGKVISPGTIVGMSAYTMHRSEDIRGQGVRLVIKDARVARVGAAASSILVTNTIKVAIGIVHNA
ncbi:hypothetical protein BHYA_0093g00410 [Botrytis hyacinthi]|uniref:Uncharacterized protein n=1 Tax=Botrytis hyacinthi TaxID=278943 RepID=A0A4Z1GLS5_9HELO|nr:hypothetical protein BHYA_0093g00410 [Botrytis hyacinthi]